MALVNVTPHELVIFGAGDLVVARLPPSGVVARVSTVEGERVELGGIVYTDTRYGPLEGLPEPHRDLSRPADTFVASLIVAQAARAAGRRDVVCPGELVRDDTGRPIGCRGLRRPSGSVAPGAPVAYDPSGMARGLAARDEAVELSSRPITSGGGHSE